MEKLEMLIGQLNAARAQLKAIEANEIVKERKKIEDDYRLAGRGSAVSPPSAAEIAEAKRRGKTVEELRRSRGTLGDGLQNKAPVLIPDSQITNPKIRDARMEMIMLDREMAFINESFANFKKKFTEIQEIMKKEKNE